MSRKSLNEAPVGRLPVGASGEKDALPLLRRCELCPRRCGVNRLEGLAGYCGVAAEILVAHWGPHFGEEPPISGEEGSGNIFFSSCNLRCIYCQNYQISHLKMGRRVAVDELVEIFCGLANRGCHNINLVSPTPYIPLLAMAIGDAKRRGMAIPFVYNSNGYENVEALKTLEGLIDIYLPDFKYWSGGIATRLSDVPKEKEYAVHAMAAIKEMFRQVGHLTMERGLAKRGLMIRHLVLPGGLSGSRSILEWIKKEFGRQTFVSLMSQYYPLHGAGEHPILKRRIRQGEYDALVGYLIREGFENVYIQELESASQFVPDFEKAEPFHA
jgi:putative pyruvate formate lyase activating enzyme